MATPAVFLDRDGTLIAERAYPSDPARVELVRGAGHALRRLHDAGYMLIVVTNQSGIARGYYDEATFQAVQDRAEALLARDGARLDRVYHCPHHPDITGPCECRKPGTGLFREAAAELDIDFDRSFFIGDRVKDVTPALELDGTGILVRTGYGKEHADRAPAEIEVVDDLAAAAEWILDKG